jgi:hypothetical protein
LGWDLSIGDQQHGIKMDRATTEALILLGYWNHRRRKQRTAKGYWKAADERILSRHFKTEGLKVSFNKFHLSEDSMSFAK